MGKIIKIKNGVYKGVIKQDKENKNSGKHGFSQRVWGEREGVGSFTRINPLVLLPFSVSDG